MSIIAIDNRTGRRLRLKKIQEGLYINIDGDYDYTCYICQIKSPRLTCTIPAYRIPALTDEIAEYNRNLQHWEWTFAAVAKAKQAISLLDGRQKNTLCSPECFEDFIEYYKSDIVLELAQKEWS